MRRSALDRGAAAVGFDDASIQLAQAIRALLETAAFELAQKALAERGELPLVPCDACGLDARTVRGLVTAKRLAAVKLGRRWYAKPADLAALVEGVGEPAEPIPESRPANDTGERVDLDAEAAALNAQVLGAKGLHITSAPGTAPRKAAAAGRGGRR